MRSRSGGSRPGARGGRGGVRCAGFSVVELVIVLAVVGMAAAIAVPRYSAASARYRVESAAQRVAGDLSHARKAARAASEGRIVAFTVGKGSYTLHGVAGRGDGGEDLTVWLGREPYLVELVQAEFGVDSEVRFDGHGRPDSAGLVVLRTRGHERRVVLDGTTGEVKVER